MRVLGVVDFLPFECVEFALFLCKFPIFFRNDCLMFSLINRELVLFDNVHFIS